MRACFLGQTVTVLGFGVAMLQTPPLPEPGKPERYAPETADKPVQPRLDAIKAPEAA